jgi:hypothetical protein
VIGVVSRIEQAAALEEFFISVLRQLMVDAGIPFLEVAPMPANHRFFACLTHDIDVVWQAAALYNLYFVQWLAARPPL